MTSQVGLVSIKEDVHETYYEALRLIGGLRDLSSTAKSVVIKLGVYSPTTGIHTTVDTVRAIINGFNESQKILLAESDSHAGEALARLQIWERLFNKRIVPFSLSSFDDVRGVSVTNEKIALSQVLFKPSIFVSTHVPRRYEDSGIDDLMSIGSILKNLLGLIPDKKKARFHKRLPRALMDLFEAIGGIDLAVLDGSYTYLGRNKERKRVKTDFLAVGRDAISVEAVEQYLVGLDPLANPIINEANSRGLGEADINRIEILGESANELRERIVGSFAEL